MSTYLSPLFLKARTDLDALVRKHDLSAAQLGFYYVLMAVSKRDLSDGLLTLREVSKEAGSIHFRGWKKSLEKLAEAGLITEITDTHIQLDWAGQTTREAVEKRSVTRADGTHDIPKMHERGEHTYCRKPHCDVATEYAKGYDQNGKIGVTERVTSKSEKGDHPPVTQSQSQRQSQKDSGYDEDEKARQNRDSTPSPSGGARPEPADELGNTNRAPTDSAPTDDDFGIYDMTQGGKRIA